MILSKRPDIERFLKDPTGVIACLIHGKDRGQVRERAQALAQTVVKDPNDPFDVSVLTDSDLETDPARLEGELAALSMMGGRRLIRLKLSTDKAGPDKQTTEALKLHAEGALNPDAFFLIEAPALGRDSALRKLAEKLTNVRAIAIYDDEGADLARLTREQLQTDGVGLSNDALDLFVSRLPKERGVARQEIERLILYLGPKSGKIATPEDLTAFLGVEPEASFFEAAFDAFGGKTQLAQQGLRRAFNEGESPVMAIRALSMHLAKLRRAQILSQAGTDPKDISKACQVFWKQEREFFRQMRAWTLEALNPITQDVLDADQAIKSTGSPDQLLAERMVLSIALRAKRLGL